MVDERVVARVPLKYSILCGHYHPLLDTEVRDGVVVCPHCGQSESIVDMVTSWRISGDKVDFKATSQKFTLVLRS